MKGTSVQGDGHDLAFLPKICSFSSFRGFQGPRGSRLGLVETLLLIPHKSFSPQVIEPNVMSRCGSADNAVVLRSISEITLA
jgi:hypothetical protein